MNSILSAPRTDSFHFRINPEVRKEVEAVYAKNGISFTQAINIFIQQSLNAGGFPFPVTADNAEYVRAEAMKRLMRELDTGRSSGDPVDEADVYRMLEAEDLS
ncbi:MAG: type II toxin-antitoxin system RelB/DinJ family antitoxin [Oscillospiraceae bacterium]|jgi:DNA-damage-inducible protein J|nr:type II toxin-antitoxin system RelB/DinJ family antitoxin [Oscillospiraceae bacterium]